MYNGIIYIVIQIILQETLSRFGNRNLLLVTGFILWKTQTIIVIFFSIDLTIKYDHHNK